MKSYLTSLGIGITSGIFGGLAGLGGSVVGIPLLTTIGRLTQHQAHGTSVFGALATGAIGASTFYVYGSKEKSVDIPAALTVTISAVITTSVAARRAQKLSGPTLLNILGSFMLCTSAIVIAKPILGHVKEKQQSLFWSSNLNKFLLVGIGTVTGVASGMFGVGGGIVMVPLLSLLGDQQTALGTSLLASLGPTITSAYTHFKMRNTSTSMVLPLMIGSGIGVYLGSIGAISLTDTQQRALFSSIMLILGARNIYAARSASQIIKHTH